MGMTKLALLLGGLMIAALALLEVITSTVAVDILQP